MILVAGFLIALVSVPLFGGRLRRLSAMRFERGWLLLAALGLQVVLIDLLPRELPGWVANGVHLASFGFALGFVLANRRVPAIAVLAVGGLCNTLVIAANGGVMPASRHAMATAGIDMAARGEFRNSTFVAHPNLAFLGDMFAIPARFPLANVFSAGDVLLVVGAAILMHSVGGSLLTRRGRALRRGEPDVEVEEIAAHAPRVDAAAG